MADSPPWLSRPLFRRLPGSWFVAGPAKDVMLEIYEGGIVLRELRKGPRGRELGVTWEMLAEAAVAREGTLKGRAIVADTGKRLEWLLR